MYCRPDPQPRYPQGALRAHIDLPVNSHTNWLDYSKGAEGAAGSSLVNPTARAI